MVKWFVNVRDYWRFVHQRRLDLEYRVFPLKTLVICLALLCTLPIIAILLVDSDYLEFFRGTNGKPDRVWLAITDLGKSDWILYSTGSLIIVMSVFSADRFRKNHHFLWHRIYLNVYYIFTTVALSGLLALLLKAVFSRARPEFVAGEGVWESKFLQFAYEYSSFPSGHSTTAGAMAIGLSLLFPRFTWFFVPAGLVIAFSRNMVYAHFPSDTIAGFLLGAMFSYFYARSFARKRLLFCYTGKGGITLRGEGNIHMGLLPQKQNGRVK